MLKNIRNNCTTTEKTQTLEFTDPDFGKIVFAKWSDLKQIYNEEVGKPIKRTKLDYQPLYPNNFEKQKVSLVLTVFNEKTVAALKRSKFTDRALFIENIMRMWHRNLEDPGRYPINSPDDERLNYIERIAASLKLMDN